MTAFSWACGNESLDFMHILFDRGADVNLDNRSGKTPCYVAASCGHENVVRTLHELGADLHLMDQFGTTPCLIAAQKGHSNVVNFLLCKGAELLRTCHVRDSSSSFLFKTHKINNHTHLHLHLLLIIMMMMMMMMIIIIIIIIIWHTIPYIH